MSERLYLILFLALGASLPRAQALVATDKLSQYGRQSWQTGSGLPQNTVTAIAQTPDGLLWIGTEEGLARFDGYNFLVYTTQNTPELKSNSITRLQVVGGGLEATTAVNVVRFFHGRFVASVAQPSGLMATGLDEVPPELRAHVACSLKDHENALWVGTSKGLFRVRPGVPPEPFGNNDLLASAGILSLFEDHEGNLWVGTEDAGLQMVKDQRFTTYTNDRVRCVFQDHHGTVWIGTDGSGLKRLDLGAISTVTSANGLSSDVVLSLAEDPGGALLAGTPDGLNVLQRSSISTQTSGDGLPEDFVRSLFTDKDGSLWIGTRRGLAHVKQDRVTIYTESNGLGSDLVGAITRDKQGDLWVGTLHGLSRFHDGSFTNYTVADGLSSNVITDLFADQDGYLWIATQGGSLDRLRDEMFTHASPSQGIPATLYGVAGDNRGNLWLAAPSGIIRARKGDFDRAGSGVSTYGTSDGLRVAECTGGGHPAVWKTPSGDIWFATARGAALLSAAHTAIDDPPPSVFVETITIDDAPFSPESVVAIAAGHSRLALQYAGISLSDPQDVRYRYKLDGFDSDWVEAGSRRTAFYTNLTPGAYNFRVRARSAAGVWSDSGAYQFQVLPHFYQTWWFRALLAGLIVLAIYAAFRWRVRQVRSEFRAVLNERTRIAREIHDTLAQGFAGVSVQLEVVSRLLPSGEDAAQGKVRQHLDQARMLARTCLDDARRSIWELRSQGTEREDLATRFSKLARTASAHSNMSVLFQIHGTYRTIEPRVEDEILRIGQEAITNALRHSRGQTVRANLTFGSGTLRLTVSDDGCGMDNSSNDARVGDGHYGITGMRERAESIDAEFSVVSEHGGGTTICVEAPLR